MRKKILILIAVCVAVIVAATATSALMLSVDATLTPLQIRNVILKSSVHLPNLTTLCISGGCLDAYNSVLNINQ